MDDTIGVERVPRGTVMPQRPGPEPRTFLMGVLDAEDRPVPSSLFSRHRAGVERQMGYPPPPPARRDRAAGEAMHMGLLVDHFGHFLLESLSRAWYAARRPDLPLAWSIPRGREPGYRTWQADILAVLGVANPPLFLTRPTQFDEVHVPAAGYRIQTFMHPVQRDFLARTPHRPEPGRFTWLSRARLDQRGNRTAPLLDRRLEAAGWQVLYPETMSIAEQLAALAASERVAGEQGSALHMLLLLRDAGRLRVDIFDRDGDRQPKFRNANYATIAAAKSLDQRIHACAFERVIWRGGAVVDKIAENSFRYLDVLGVPMKKEAASVTSIPGKDGAAAAPAAAPVDRSRTPSGTVPRLQALAARRRVERYLEIGVAQGRTFLHLDFPVMHAVDPGFRFDVRRHETPKKRFFEMTSDDFFCTFAETSVKYDLMFIDGLHTFEQTFRDFCASLSHAHDGTVWLIDDVLPNDVFSSLPDETEARRYRDLHHRSEEPGRGPWHGDVYKAIFALHDFFPNLDYRTIGGKGNKQTVVIRRPRKDFKPRFNNLETISRLSYFDLQKNRELMRLTPEADVLAWLAD